jgi:undecaprenyl-diphosphatase
VEWLQKLSVWVAAYPGWTLGAIFVICVVECLLIVGLFAPGGILLFLIGALISLHVLELVPTLVTAAIGALCGDWISYEFGRRYGDALFKRRFFLKRPALAERGARFFERHGNKGLIFAHLVGLLRPMMPAMAGAYGLTRLRFALGIVPAAAVWAVAYVMPGVAFGTSLGLAAEVTLRLATLILALAVILGFGLWLSRRAVLGMSRNAEVWLNQVMDWSHRHRRLGRFGAALADPEQPELPVLAGLAALLLIVGGATLALLIHLGLPLALDRTVEETLRNLHEPGGLRLAVAVSLLGSPQVYLSFGAMLLGLLLLRRQAGAAYHLLAATGFGGAAAWSLSLAPAGLAAPATGHLGLTSDLILLIGLYGFAPILLGVRAGASLRIALYTLAALGLLLVVLSRLYLGAAWLSVTLTEGLVGFVWVSAVGIAYRRHEQAPPSMRRLWPAGIALLLALATTATDFGSRLRAVEPDLETQPLSASGWWAEGWKRLPARRVDMAGRDKQFFNLQWAGPLDTIQQALLASGWQAAEPLSLPNALRWLAPEGPVADLPLLPRMHAGRYDLLALRLPIDNDHQYLLRLWHSGYVLDDGTPLWVGSLTVQRAGEFFRLLRYTLNENLYTAALTAMPPLPPTIEKRDVLRAPGSFTTRLLRPAPAPTL